MTAIAFHILPAATPGDSVAYLCQTIASAFDAGQKVYAYAADQTLTHALDEQLWQFETTRFIPHAIMGADPKWSSSPIHIGWTLPTDRRYDLLLNLSLNAVPNPKAFKQIVEIVPAMEEWLNAARDRYRSYRAAGHTLQNHDFRKAVDE